MQVPAQSNLLYPSEIDVKGHCLYWFLVMVPFQKADNSRDDYEITAVSFHPHPAKKTELFTAPINLNIILIRRPHLCVQASI